MKIHSQESSNPMESKPVVSNVRSPFQLFTRVNTVTYPIVLNARFSKSEIISYLEARYQIDLGGSFSREYITPICHPHISLCIMHSPQAAGRCSAKGTLRGSRG
jgi:hypothetical protein